MTNEKSSPSKEENVFDIQYACFMVDEKPYCLWDYDIPAITMTFLESIDPTYYEFIANTYLVEDSEEINLPASLLLRTIYSQALETLFAFIGATLQAPLCAPAWIDSYQIGDVRSIVEKITDGKTFPTILKDKKISWQKVSEFIHYGLILEDKIEENRIKTNFANLWGRFSFDFRDRNFSDEYNSIKHGLRVRPGGFHVAIGIQETPGVTAPPEKMRLLGKSEYGSSFFVKDEIGKKIGKKHKHHFQLRRYHRNWNPKDFVEGLKLISISMQNIISATKILNGVPGDQVQFIWPTEDETFEKPWQRSRQIGVLSMGGIQRNIPIGLIKPFTEEELKSMYDGGGHFLQGIRYHFVDKSDEADND